MWEPTLGRCHTVVVTEKRILQIIVLLYNASDYTMGRSHTVVFIATRILHRKVIF